MNCPKCGEAPTGVKRQFNFWNCNFCGADLSVDDTPEKFRIVCLQFLERCSATSGRLISVPKQYPEWLEKRIEFLRMMLSDEMIIDAVHDPDFFDWWRWRRKEWTRQLHILENDSGRFAEMEKTYPVNMPDIAIDIENDRRCLFWSCALGNKEGYDPL